MASVALVVYTRIVERLRRELKIAPSPETSKLAERIRRQHQDLSDDQPAAVSWTRFARALTPVG